MTAENQSGSASDSDAGDERSPTSGESVRRRQLLGVVASTGAAALAGCTFEFDDDGFEVSFDSDDGDDLDSGSDGDATDSTGEDPEDVETSGGDDENETGDPKDEEEADPQPSFSEDCIGVDPSDLSIDEISGGRWRVSSGRSALLVFDDRDNAEKAIEIIKHYGFSSYCFVGRPDPPMTYWLTDGNAPSASGSPAGGEDCIGFDPSDLSIDEISGGRWRVSSGRKALLVFDDRDNAEKAIEIIEHYGFTSYCFVGRPNPPMTYWTR